jgi:hypothetical protein
MVGCCGVLAKFVTGLNSFYPGRQGGRSSGLPTMAGMLPLAEATAPWVENLSFVANGFRETRLRPVLAGPTPPPI